MCLGEQSSSADRMKEYTKFFRGDFSVITNESKIKKSLRQELKSMLFYWFLANTDILEKLPKGIPGPL